MVQGRGYLDWGQPTNNGDLDIGQYRGVVTWSVSTGEWSDLDIGQYRGVVTWSVTGEWGDLDIGQYRGVVTWSVSTGEWPWTLTVMLLLFFKS